MTSTWIRLLMKKLPLLFLLFSVLAVEGQEIGLQLYSVRHQSDEDLEGTLQRVGEMGIHYVEGGGFGTYGLKNDAFNKLLAVNKLNMVSVGASFDELRDSLDKIVSRAASVDARHVVWFWVPHQDTIFRIKETQLAIHVFNEAGRKLMQSRITLCYHPHGY